MDMRQIAASELINGPAPSVNQVIEKVVGSCAEGNEAPSFGEGTMLTLIHNVTRVNCITGGVDIELECHR